MSSFQEQDCKGTRDAGQRFWNRLSKTGGSKGNSMDAQAFTVLH